MHWEPIPENNRGGPITHYTVKYYPLSPDGRVRKSIEDLFQFVDTNQTEVVIRDLNPVLGYAVSVGANTVAGIGNYSNEVTVGCKCLLHTYILNSMYKYSFKKLCFQKMV